MVTSLPDSEGIRALAAELVREDLVVFPVRHHSPACALQLRRLIARRKPACILVEGPRGFTPLIPTLAHEDARAPLAVYTYAVHARTDEAGGESRRAAYYPFCDYSPELVALREAARLDIPARFIDLDFAEQCLLESAAEDDDTQSLLDEHHFQRSHHLQALARRLGCRDHEELWEHLFETDAASATVEGHIARLTAYCHLARLDANDEALAADGTLQREAEMAWHIREAVAARTSNEGPVLAVVGGFHAVAMPGALANPSPRPSLSRKAVSDESSAVIRYSFDRLDRLNGYAAGMTSPAWHQSLWVRTQQFEKLGHPADARVRREAALALLFDIADELRTRHHLALPMPALSAAFEQVLRLTTLRQRTAPTRVDVLDAVYSCFVKGDIDTDGAIVRAVALRLLGGESLGAVPSSTVRPPLLKDFDYRARRQRLRLDVNEPRSLVLDIYRRPEHRVTSRLLHGLGLLGVPFAVRTAGPDFIHGVGLDRLQEIWEYTFTPMTEAGLVEASLYGVTVPLAVANRYVDRLDRMQKDGEGRDARAASAALVQACVLGLHDHLVRAVALLRAAIAEDADFAAVAGATLSVGLLWESREPLEAQDVVQVPAVLAAAYERAIFLGTTLRGAPGDGGPAVGALLQLRELVRGPAGESLDAGLYWEMLFSLRRDHDLPMIRGAATGLLHAAGRLDDDELGASLRGHLQGLSQPREAVSFLRGLMQTAREAAWQQPALLEVLDRLLSEWDEQAFVSNLPELRLAFAEMTPRETDRIAEAVAGLHGAKDLGTLVRHDLAEEALQRNLALSGAVESVLAEDGLAAQWGIA